LELHALTAGSLSIVDHLNGFVVIAFMVDADLGDHQGWIGDADLSTANFKLGHFFSFS
jgi:hypothetical protein